VKYRLTFINLDRFYLSTASGPMFVYNKDVDHRRWPLEEQSHELVRSYERQLLLQLHAIACSEFEA